MVEPSMIDVAEALGLGPFRRAGREWLCKAKWRGGDGWNIALNAERGVWVDWTGKAGGGGPRQLAEAVLGVAEGRTWFQSRYGTRHVKCRKARRVSVVPDEPLRRVVAALADMHKRMAGDDDDELAIWSQVGRIARTGGDEWQKLRERAEIADPETYRHWIRCTLEFEADTRRITALIVAMLAGVPHE